MFEIENAILLIDDLKGRKVADRLKLRYSGTSGLRLKSKELGIITTIKPIIKKIRRTNFRFSEKLLTEILNQAKEYRQVLKLNGLLPMFFFILPVPHF